ncbi:MAG: ABC transporter permease, partial [Bacteroidales bacterium]|nr:ABC transporter permease [Bacteroidales bacterium]
MNGIRLAFRSLFKRGRNNIIKILSLAVGLALGIVMIAKVCFESSFDRGGKDEERIYIVKEKASSKGEEHDRTYSQSSGAVGAALRKEIPQVEDATRLTFFMGDGSTIYTVPDNRMIIVNGADAAEPNVFDFIGSRMLVGDSSLLNDRKCVLVSRRVAEKFGGVAEAVGKQFKSEDFGGIYTVSGVFENIPENSSRQFDMLFSLKVMGDWSLNNWIGNDRYITLARLAKGTDAGSLQPTIDRMLAAHISPEEAEWMSKAGISLQYSLHRYDKEYSGQKDVRNSVTMLSLLAFLLIFTALMNYILIVLSTMASRTKEVAVEKCYGATGREVLGIFTAEAALHVVLSLIVAFLLVLAFKGEIEVLVGASLTSIFTVRMLGIILLVALVIFIATSVIPAYIYAKVPVAAAFRGYKSSRRNWKLGLLFVQFCATAVLVSLLAVISRQYDVMVNDDTGYSYQNLEYYDSPRVLDSSRFATMIKETAKMPEVASVTSCCNLPIEGLSGNDVSLPAGSASSEEFNVADFYFVGDGFFSTMGIPVVEGRAFDD